MAQPLYDTDVFTWSEHQSGLLRRLARGERVNAEIDWRHVIEEVRDVGRSEMRAVRSLLGRGLDHLMKIHGWPKGASAHWRSEAMVFLRDARNSYTPSMRQHIRLAEIYFEARLAAEQLRLDGRPPRPFPQSCPYRLADLLPPKPALPDLDALLRALEE